MTRIDLATGRTTVVMDAGDGLTRPGELTVDAAGSLYVANVGSPDILRLTIDGLTSVFVSGEGTLTEVSGLAFGPEGDLFILDRTIIHRFDPASGSLTAFSTLTTPGEDIEFDRDGNFYAGSFPDILTFDSQGNATVFATGFRDPRDMAVDGLGRLYVANRIGGIINAVDLSTGSVETLADLSGALGDPRGVETDLEDNVYVLTSNGEIRKWDSDGLGGDVVFQSGSSFSESLVFFSRLSACMPSSS